jgi:hypothetical protein
MAPVVTPPRITPLLEQRSAREEEPSVEAASTIHVTIGRIEVRAVPPVPPPSKARTLSPSLSLDDYLRRRGTGGAG